MKMDSLSHPHSTNISHHHHHQALLRGSASHLKSDGAGSHHPRQQTAPRFSDSAHFANIMVEFETNTREMAVDVPDSFIAQTKTPPKYPPPASVRSSTHSHQSAGNGTPPPPPLNGRAHLRIERDGRLINTLSGPPLLPHNSLSSSANSSTKSSSMGVTDGLNNDGVEEELTQRRIQQYAHEIKKRNSELELRQRSDEFLRQSLRNSRKMQALKERAQQGRAPVPAALVNGMANPAFDEDPAVLDWETLTNLIQRVSSGAEKADQPQIIRACQTLAHLATQSDFKQACRLQTQFKQFSADKKLEFPVSIDSQDLSTECLEYLQNLLPDQDQDVQELHEILKSERLEGLLLSHDKLGMRKLAQQSLHMEEDALLDRLSHYSEPNIKIVRIEKTNEPLGATVKNEDDAVIVGRIIRGGTAEASGLLHEGDEILEVNEVPLRGKNVNEVCDLLAQMQGTLTLLVVPMRSHLGHRESFSPSTGLSNGMSSGSIMHVKAHFDYDPEDDPYVPCRELGISFVKGDILHVINQKDPNWWQARREGDDDIQLPGLIPSAAFQQQREAVKHTIMQDSKSEKNGFKDQRKNSGFLCAKRSGRKKPRRRANNHLNNDIDGGIGSELDDIIAYEEVTLYYPRSDRKRPVVLIGPPNIGRQELRQRLMTNSDRFSAAIPHTSRPKRADEIDGQDYHFINRLQFENDILARKFVEHGEYERSYYGTSLEAIRSVVHCEKICVLNLHPQSLRILKSSDLMPFVVFVAPPSLEKLKRWKMDRSESVHDNELLNIIEKAREMEENYSQFFDMVIIYSDPERAYQDLLREINLIEREPQWIPGSWVNNAKS
ncbi:hypothetical protein TCAL_07862 [Tigriopus californicus]|uniref:MAGUK p55 subfamily member 5 n=1 Tax=Tigriopus californicus TaxID=6832 RepID=A0A553N6S0_TIGCA|nr:protein PALS1-like [Tigriopus californicus]TRY61093.1 hypothetical protein TCAL_07862 [Tigriopus californicus]|eukprot:TCALIF_07862-PA protein Name:"Similar to Mpp5 MAGUK p55 subfamily member 5 (Mus musculus)" AED:0.02 eAED:0.02 QI:712/1/1/1/1/1/3/298/832